MNRQTSKWILLLCILALVVGCGPYKAGTNASPMQETERVILLDHGLTYYLNVVKQAAERTPAGNLKIKLAIENEEDKDVPCDVQVVFRDKDGFELESTNWAPFIFHRRKVSTYEQMSLNTQVTDYRVLIRNMKRQ
jgi:hypothetical protein